MSDEEQRLDEETVDALVERCGETTHIASPSWPYFAQGPYAADAVFDTPELRIGITFELSCESGQRPNSLGNYELAISGVGDIEAQIERNQDGPGFAACCSWTSGALTLPIAARTSPASSASPTTNSMR